MSFLTSLQIQGLLSFPPDAEMIELRPLNLLIGPNGSGKSNLIEAIGLLKSLPSSFATAIREGGGIKEWLWKGESFENVASLNAATTGQFGTRGVGYHLAFVDEGYRTEVIEERITEFTGNHSIPLYKNDAKSCFISIADDPKQRFSRSHRELDRESLQQNESILSQRKEPDLYPELSELGNEFSRIQILREWSMGRGSPIRQPQPADLPTDHLLPDGRNLALLLNNLEHEGDIEEFNDLLTQFLPRFSRMSTRIQEGTIQFFLHEKGLRAPIPATRLSDGTLRFIAMLAILLSPSPPPLACIEEPELGLHPDAISIFGDVLVKAQTRMQLIVTTHSDALVSALSDHADSVLVCEYHRGTTIKRVESGLVQHWLEKFRLGEVWRIGALGGNP